MYRARERGILSATKQSKYVGMLLKMLEQDFRMLSSLLASGTKKSIYNNFHNFIQPWWPKFIFPLKAYLFWKCEFCWQRDFWSLIFLLERENICLCSNVKIA